MMPEAFIDFHKLHIATEHDMHCAISSNGGISRISICHVLTREYLACSVVNSQTTPTPPYPILLETQPTMSNAASPFVTLISNDGFEFIVSRDAACVANTIKKMLDPTSKPMKPPPSPPKPKKKKFHVKYTLGTQTYHPAIY